MCVNMNVLFELCKAVCDINFTAVFTLTFRLTQNELVTNVLTQRIQTCLHIYTDMYTLSDIQNVWCHHFYV